MVFSEEFTQYLMPVWLIFIQFIRQMIQDTHRSALSRHSSLFLAEAFASKLQLIPDINTNSESELNLSFIKKKQKKTLLQHGSASPNTCNQLHAMVHQSVTAHYFHCASAHVRVCHSRLAPVVLPFHSGGKPS